MSRALPGCSALDRLDGLELDPAAIRAHALQLRSLVFSFVVRRPPWAPGRRPRLARALIDWLRPRLNTAIAPSGPTYTSALSDSPSEGEVMVRRHTTALRASLMAADFLGALPCS